MPLFHYETINAKGIRSEGTLEAKDKISLYHVLKTEGITIVSARELSEKLSLSIFTDLPFLNKVKAHDKIIFARNLSKMIDAGLPITRGLSIMERESKGELKKVLKNLSESISKGNTLSISMKAYPKVFTPLFVSMVSAGEESGNLSIALKNVALEMEKSYQLNKKIKGALMYPTIILGLMVVIGILMMIYMVPTLTSTFTGLGLKLPLSTRIIIGTSNFLVAYFLYVIIAFIVFIFLAMYALRSLRGQRYLDFVLLRIPVIKEMVKQINSARTTRTMSSLISAGVDIVIAISVTKDVLQNSFYKEVLEEVQIAIQKGNPISSVFSAHENLYPIFVSEMVSVGEETGKIGEMLLSVALFYEEEIDQKTKDMSSIIEPLLMVFIGLAVGIFAVSIISPIYSIGDSIK
ncbi:type II secretion system F family protein [Patescibacteria group bacterium]|nr:type II secretion system F family protein [Patescibacteria group bacterium]